MLQRLLSILLVLALPVQGFAAPHSHGAQPNDHNQRPHLHLADHHHHHIHSHEGGHAHDSCPTDNSGNEQPEAPSQPSNHDDGALYVSGEVGLNSSRAVPMVADIGLVSWTDVVSPTGIDARSSVDAVPLVLARGDTPIYLTTLSLRL